MVFNGSVSQPELFRNITVNHCITQTLVTGYYMSMQSDIEIMKEAGRLLGEARFIQDEQALVHIGPSLLNMADETNWAHKLMAMPVPSTSKGFRFRVKSVMGEILRCAVSLRNAENEAGRECTPALAKLREEMFLFLRHVLQCRPDLFPAENGLTPEWNASDTGLSCIRGGLMLECMFFRDKWVARLGGVFVSIGNSETETMRTAEAEAEAIFSLSRLPETYTPEEPAYSPPR